MEIHILYISCFEVEKQWAKLFKCSFNPLKYAYHKIKLFYPQTSMEISILDEKIV
jgi:hypothetical protein